MSASQTAALAQRWDTVMMANYGTPPIALARGQGSVVWDVDGREYLDLIAGIAVATLGHAHPAITTAISEQSQQLIHVSNLAMHEPGVRLAERLLDLTGQQGRVFFSQDGASANEAAYKLVRKYAWRKDPSGESLKIVSTEGSFHGRTMGALSLTGTAAKRDPFQPLPGPVEFVPYGEVSALDAAVDDQTAAVFLEPVQGEGGVVLPPAGYLAAARDICDRAGALLVVDEVQSGIGRTGEWFMSTAQGVRPDILTLAKGLAGGMPLGVCIGFGETGELFAPGDHGSTFGGNPVSVAAAHAVLDTIADQDLLSHVRDTGEVFAANVNEIDHPLLGGQRGVGLWRAIHLSASVAPVFEKLARDRGYLVNAVKADVIRIAPALTITQAQLTTFIAELPSLLDATAEQSAEEGV